MIYVKIEPDGPGRSKCVCGIEGDLKTLTLHTIEAIHAIYRAMAEDGGPAGSLELFKLGIAMAVGSPKSPVWDLSDDPKDGRKTGSCQLMGSEKEIAEETLDALGTIYAAIRGEFDPAFMLAFRQYLTLAVLDPSSPVWTTQPAGGEKVVFRPPEERRPEP